MPRQRPSPHWISPLYATLNAHWNRRVEFCKVFMSHSIIGSKSTKIPFTSLKKNMDFPFLDK